MRKKTHDEFLEEVKNKNVHVKIIGTYVKDGVKIECECVYCHKRIFMRPYDLLCGKKCYACAKKIAAKQLAKTHEQFASQLYEINPDIKIIGEYKQAKTPIECECLIHHRRFFSAPTHLLRGQCGCRECISNGIRERSLKSNDKFVAELSDINPNIVPIEQYKGSHSKIKLLCKRCNNTWSAEPTSLLNGNGCPFCNESHGEKMIARLLDNHSIYYQRQIRFPDGLRGVGGLPLSYDFYIPDFNLLIEYQGEFHTKGLTGKYQSDEQYEIQHEHDRRKKQFAIDNKYNFLEIWHYDKDNIDEIMNREINKYKNPVTTTV